MNPDVHQDWVDLKYWADRWLDSPCTEPDWCEGADINEDGIANLVDYGCLANHWLAGVP